MRSLFSYRFRGVMGTFALVFCVWYFTIRTYSTTGLAECVGVEWGIRFGFWGAIALADLASTTLGVRKGASHVVTIRFYVLY